MPCLIKPDMHHTWLCIMRCLCDDCLLCCLLLSGLPLSLASVSFRSCEDPFDNVGSSSPWTRFFFIAGSQVRWPLPWYHFYLCLLASLFYRYAALPITCSLSLPNLPCQPLTFSPFLANRCLAMLPLCSAPLIALLVAGEEWSLFHVGTWILLGYHYYYILFTLMHIFTW